jgi:hypothetical protein
MDVSVSAWNGNNYQERLEPEEPVDLVSDWADGGLQHYMDFSYTLNDVAYRTGDDDEAAQNPKRFKPLKRVKDGGHISIRIFEDHWEW